MFHALTYTDNPAVKKQTASSSIAAVSLLICTFYAIHFATKYSRWHSYYLQSSIYGPSA